MASNLFRITTICFLFYLNILHLNAELSTSCERGNPDYEENSPKCNTGGTYKCGICECHDPYFGRRCECLKGDADGSSLSESNCRPPGSTASIDCSGRGTCVCNQCECEKRENPNEIISGKWCECDNYSCFRHGGEICGGHGTCDCGHCICTPPWTGDACECYNANNTCYPPFQENPKLCNGHGDCVCGVCQCHSTSDGKYTGRYCERCPNCTEICDELRPCVLCQIYHVGPYDDDKCVKRCGDFPTVEVEVIKADEENDEFPCEGYDEYDCRHEFTYKRISETKLAVKAHRVCSIKR